MQHEVNNAKKGTIKLLDRGGEILFTVNYQSAEHRKRIIANWRMLYREKINHCYLDIDPYFDERKVRQDGTNFGSPKIFPVDTVEKNLPVSSPGFN